MDNKSFIQGLLFGLSFSESILREETSFNPGSQVIIWFEDGSKLTFAINRGIDHIYGNNAAMLTQEDSCNLFDIAINWVTVEQSDKIESLGFDFEEAEIRVTLDELVFIINALGVIDYSITQQEWMKIFLKVYHQK